MQRFSIDALDPDISVLPFGSSDFSTILAGKKMFQLFQVLAVNTFFKRNISTFFFNLNNEKIGNKHIVNLEHLAEEFSVFT